MCCLIVPPITYHSPDNFSKENMFAVQPSSSVQKDEELRAVCICSVVGHGHISTGFVAQLEVFINECRSVDTFAWGKK